MQREPARIIGDIRTLVGVPSVSSADPALDMSNRGVLERLSDMLEAAGFRLEWLEVPGQPGKLNLVATLGEGPAGLALSGHSDTVPYDESAWNSDPFVLTERDGRLYGLGTADMKSFFAIILAAAARHPPGELQRSLVVIATADEETGMSGARALVDGGRKLADAVLIGEPTGLRPIRVHKGILAERIVLTGRSGHSSNPSLGISALDGMRAVLNELAAFRQELREQDLNDAFEVPYPTLNFGRIRGGDNPNRICAECTLDLDCRFLPGMSVDGMRRLIRERVRRCLDGSGLAVDFRPLFAGIDAMDTPADAALVRAVERLTGEQAGAVAFATEAPLFARLGSEVVVAGPGSIDQAHQPDEYLELAAITPAVDMLANLIGEYCR